MPTERRRTRVPVIRREMPPGTSPGTITVDPDAPKPRITAIAFGPDELVERQLESAEEITPLIGTRPVLWVNVDGLGDRDTLAHIGESFGLHALALEDVVHVPQRAKAEPYDDHLFVVARMIRVDARLETEQISMFVGDGYVLTFQEREGDSFENVRRRLRSAGSRIRRSASDYLAYALLDAVIDAYYPVLEHYGDRIEALEEEVLGSPDADVAARIHTLKRELLLVRRALSPHREAIHAALRDDTAFIGGDTNVYLRDCQDHVIQLLDITETYRELSSGLLDVHLTSVSNRMNEVMKVLTIFAAIFIPLSFIAGLYGMNFDQSSSWNMPELRWAFGYPAVLVVMAAVAGGLLVFFHQRGWIGGSRPRKSRDD